MNLEKQLKEVMGYLYEKPKFELRSDGRKTDQQVLHEPFEIEVHKKQFVAYLEVVILEDGTVCYAVPSHRYFCEAYLMKLKKWTRKELLENCPREYWADYNTWLTQESETVMVWNDFYQGEPNEKQIRKLQELASAGIYLGGI